MGPAVRHRRPVAGMKIATVAASPVVVASGQRRLQQGKGDQGVSPDRVVSTTGRGGCRSQCGRPKQGLQALDIRWDDGRTVTISTPTSSKGSGGRAEPAVVVRTRACGRGRRARRGRSSPCTRCRSSRTRRWNDQLHGARPPGPLRGLDGTQVLTRAHREPPRPPVSRWRR